MDKKGAGTVVGFFLYFWIFEIAAFVVFKFMGLVSFDDPLKRVLILFVIIGLAYTGMYFIKKSGDRKRAARKEAAQYEVSGTKIQKKHSNGKKKKKK